MKKILISVSIIAAAAAIVIGATTAFFSDTETSTGNTFTAGTIDIAIDGQNPWTGNYSIGDLKPGETGNITFNIANVGTNPVNVSKNLSNWNESTGLTGYSCTGGSISGTINVSSEPECVEARTHGSDVNNVQSQIIYDLSVKVYGTSEEGNLIWWQEIYNVGESKSLTDVYGTGQYVALGMIPVGGHMKVTQSYHFNQNAGNEYQGDALSFDITIKGDQMAQVGGYTTVALENKTGAPYWNIIQGDNIEGTLNYKTQGPKFDYNFTGKVKTTGDYTLLYVGSTNNYPCTGSVILGTGYFTAGTSLLISGQVVTGDITSGKIWLIPSSSYSSGLMGPWPEADILFETGLINYDQN